MLVAPSSGGLECGARTQFRECEPTECYSFYHGEEHRIDMMHYSVNMFKLLWCNIAIIAFTLLQ